MNIWYLIELLLFSNLLLIIFLNFEKLLKLFTLFLTLSLVILFSFSISPLFPFNRQFLLYLPPPFTVFSPSFALDHLNAFFALLSVLIILCCLINLCQHHLYNFRTLLFFFWLIEFSLIHTFTTQNLMIFYLLFELTLLPMFFIIFSWGKRQRRSYAALLFFFYTAIGSILLLLGLLVLYQNTKTFNLLILSSLELDLNTQLVLWLLFFFGFSTKVPVFPAHIWLPEAHVEAPTVGSVLLAGLLLKIGTIGLLKFMFPLLIGASLILGPIAITLAMLSIFHGSISAMLQTDLKKIIAYSSISHMGFVLLGLFSLNLVSLTGSILTMLVHGLVSSALFFLVGTVYDRYKTRNILAISRLAGTMPVFSLFFFLFTLANLGMPGTANFVAELFVLLGATSYNVIVSITVLVSMILTAIYSVWTFSRLVFGPKCSGSFNYSDLAKVEFYPLFILLALVLFLGFKPAIFFNFVVPSLVSYIN